jgi:hypothetical protein
MSAQIHAPSTLPRGKAPDTDWLGSSMGPIVGLDWVAKRKIPFIASAGNLTTVIQPVV